MVFLGEDRQVWLRWRLFFDWVGGKTEVLGVLDPAGGLVDIFYFTLLLNGWHSSVTWSCSVSISAPIWQWLGELLAELKISGYATMGRSHMLSQEFERQMLRQSSVHFIHPFFCLYTCEAAYGRTRRFGRGHAWRPVAVVVAVAGFVCVKWPLCI
jgi:hypothetical protein